MNALLLIYFIIIIFFGNLTLKSPYDVLKLPVIVF